MTARRWLRRIGEVLLLVAVVVAVQGFLGRDLAQGRAPPLPVPAVAGAGAGEDAPRAARQAGPVLVYFWATWCPICDLQSGAVSRIAEDHPVLTVALQSGDAAAVREHLGAAGLDFPVAVDPEGELAAAWGVRGVPATFVIGPEGAILFSEQGYRTGPGLRARLWWARVSTGSPGAGERREGPLPSTTGAPGE